MSRPRLLDLFSGAGGSAVGYHRAGFDVVGVDHTPQPRYPFAHIVADALEFCREHGHEFDAIHASPPCQAYSPATSRNRRRHYREHADLLEPTRRVLQETERPWVIENVPGSPIAGVVMLCGSSFGLDVRRHRWFESSVLLFGLACEHARQTPRFRSLDSRRSAGSLACVVGVHGHLNYPGELALRQAAMGIDWMRNDELSQAIPPAYTLFVGTQLLRALAVDEIPAGALGMD